MSMMFAGNPVFNQPLDKWDVSSVTNMIRMFSGCIKFNNPLNSWGDKLRKVTDMSGMFTNCRLFNQPLNKWNVGSVMNMSDMFSDCESFNQPLNKWAVSSTTNMRGMFKGCPIENFNKPRVYPYTEKRRAIQQHLLLLIHAHRCQLPNQPMPNQPNVQICKVHHCSTMKGVLAHMQGCKESEHCQYPHCVSSRQIISHYNKCQKLDCPICSKLRKPHANAMGGGMPGGMQPHPGMQQPVQQPQVPNKLNESFRANFQPMQREKLKQKL